jgi:hypothetical protein
MLKIGLDQSRIAALARNGTEESGIRNKSDLALEPVAAHAPCRSPVVPNPSSDPVPEPDDDPTLVAKIERMLDLAPHVGVDRETMALVARRLLAREAERADILTSRGRSWTR